MHAYSVATCDSAFRLLGSEMESVARRKTFNISVYLPMKNKEVDTWHLIERLLNDSSFRVSVPKIVGEGSADMRMVHVASMSEASRGPQTNGESRN